MTIFFFIFLLKYGNIIPIGGIMEKIKIYIAFSRDILKILIYLLKGIQVKLNYQYLKEKKEQKIKILIYLLM